MEHRPKINAPAQETKVQSIPVTRVHSSHFVRRMQDSPTDPDARISVKPGKARKLNYLSQLSVDTANHVITDIRAYHADGKDNQQLQDIVQRLQRRLWQQGLVFKNCVADTGYSSGENYAFLEKQGFKEFYSTSWHLQRRAKWYCIYRSPKTITSAHRARAIPFKKVFLDSRTKTKKKSYRASSKICKGCTLRSCVSGQGERETVLGDLLSQRI